MSTCETVIAFLDDYVAETLPADRRESFDHHLAACPSCVAYLASYRETIRLAKATIEDIPPEVITAIVATIARNTPRP